MVSIHFPAFILLAVSLKTRLQVELSTSFHHFPFARFGCPFAAAVACNYCRSHVNFLYITKIKSFIRSRPSKTLMLLIIILSGDIQVNPGPTSYILVVVVNSLLPEITKKQYAEIIASHGTTHNALNSV